MAIDPGTITLIQTTFLQHVAGAFDSVSHYAQNLLYIFATFEVVLFGLFWAMQQGMAWERLFFKVIKIGLIFFIIQNYSDLLNTILNSFVQLGGIVADTKHLSQVIFNPAVIWKYGYDMGILLLKAATTANAVGLSLLMIVLGFAIILVFGLLGIQIILQLVGFYLVALLALLFLPFGAFNPGAGMFDRAVQSVLKAGARVMVLIMVIGVAVTVWDKFDLTGDIQLENISQPLGLFFSGLLFLVLSWQLPKLVASVVGEISMRMSNDNKLGSSESTVTVSPNMGGQFGGANAVQAATSLSPGGGSGAGFGGGAGSTSAGSTVTVAPGQASAGGGSSFDSGQSDRQSGRGRLSDASTVKKHLSDGALKQLKQTVQQALRENDDG